MATYKLIHLSKDEAAAVKVAIDLLTTTVNNSFYKRLPVLEGNDLLMTTDSITRSDFLSYLESRSSTAHAHIKKELSL